MTKKRYETIKIAGKSFTLDTKETVINPIVFYKGIYDVYGRPSTRKVTIWKNWADWFMANNSHMFGITSHNSNFFTIQGCITAIDEQTSKPVEYFLKITASNNYAWRVSRD